MQLAWDMLWVEESFIHWHRYLNEMHGSANMIGTMKSRGLYVSRRLCEIHFFWEQLSEGIHFSTGHFSELIPDSG